MRHVFLAAISMLFSVSSQAALIDRDWQIEGDAGITYHTETAPRVRIVVTIPCNPKHEREAESDEQCRGIRRN
jgi:hypothetical protein